MGVIVILVYCNKVFGGIMKFIVGLVIEIIFVIVIVLLMMVFYSYFVVCVFLGKKVSWDV